MDARWGFLLVFPSGWWDASVIRKAEKRMRDWIVLGVMVLSLAAMLLALFIIAS